MTSEATIKQHRQLIISLKATIDRAFAARTQRIDAVKAEENAKLNRIIEQARLTAEASARANLPPGYIMNSETMITQPPVR